MDRESGPRLLASLLAAFLLAACSGLDVTVPDPPPGVDLNVSNAHPALVTVVVSRQLLPVWTSHVPTATDTLIGVHKQPWADRLTGGPVQFLLSSGLDQRVVKSDPVLLDAGDVVEIDVPPDLQSTTVEVRGK